MDIETIDGRLELRRCAEPGFDLPPVAWRFARPADEIANVLLYAATDAGISRSTSINFAELIS